MKPDQLPGSEHREALWNSIRGLKVFTKKNHGLAELVQDNCVNSINGFALNSVQPKAVDYCPVLEGGQNSGENLTLLEVKTIFLDEFGRMIEIIFEIQTDTTFFRELTDHDRFWLISKLLPEVHFLRKSPDGVNFAGLPKYSALPDATTTSLIQNKTIVLTDSPQTQSLDIYET